MMHMMHATRCKSIRVHALDGASDAKGWRISRSTLAAGPTPHPPRPRVTATARYFQRKVLAFAVRFGGSSHFRA
jgi:hypothetical protein